ncbi:MAG: squalene/phytoene synthase family protein [Candidatus Poseidoniaceae archaeon]|nr:squalene/phytoene synthase family protein [Candidatus Poseidoniaceae archaeon]
MSELRMALDACERRAKEASSSFVASFGSLPAIKRAAVNAVYAYCRWVDDIVDGDADERLPITQEVLEFSTARMNELVELHGRRPSDPQDLARWRLEALSAMRLRLRAFAAGEQPAADEHPVMRAMAWVMATYSVRLLDLETIIDGMEDDLFPTEVRSWEDVRAYCFKVASAVGLVLIEIYGYEDARARLHAIDMGIQLQLINILRDVQEDLERGRVYLPLDVLESHGLSREDLSDVRIEQDHRWRAFIRDYCEAVEEHQASAKDLLPLLDRRTRAQPGMMVEAYESLLSSIVRTEGAVFSHRPKVGLITKARLAIRVMWSNLTRDDLSLA